MIPCGMSCYMQDFIEGIKKYPAKNKKEV